MTVETNTLTSRFWYVVLGLAIYVVSSSIVSSVRLYPYRRIVEGGTRRSRRLPWSRMQDYPEARRLQSDG